MFNLDKCDRGDKYDKFGPSRFEGTARPEDPLLLLDYADDIVPLLLARLSDSHVSSNEQIKIREELDQLMKHVENIKNSDCASFIRELRSHVNREISRIDVHRSFILDSNPSAEVDFELLVDLEDRILSLIEEFHDSGSTPEQRFLAKLLIGSAMQEMRAIDSSSMPLFRMKINELNKVVRERLGNVELEELPEISIELFDDDSSLYLDRLFEEIN